VRSAEDRLELLDTILTQTASRGLLMRTAGDEPLDGRTVVLDGRRVLNFGSCSYLGLELDPRLQEGVVEAVRRYGTQFSSSRSYLSAPAYLELEALLEQLFGGPALVAASTSLGHLSTLPVLVGPRDAVLLDQQVHQSVQLAANLLRTQGTTVELVRHDRLDALERRVGELAASHRHVWYMADGVYSMYGDLAPLEELGAMLDRHEQLHLYVDDSHGMSWYGRHGRGYALEHLPIRERMVVTASLNKAFACAGAAIVFPDEETRRKVRTCGQTLIFAGPVQPPMLGAALASARIHLSPEIDALQAALRERVELATALMQEHELPLVAPSATPIRFVGCGVPGTVAAAGARLLEAGYYTNAAPFPAVPMKRGGIRTTLTLHHSREDIRGLVEAMADTLPGVLAEHGSSVAAVRRTFGLAPPASAAPAPAPAPVPALRLETASSVAALDAAEWDGLLGDAGSFTAAGLRFLEAAFAPGAQAARPEDEWRFRYYLVRDAQGVPVLATFFTAALWKDDMLASAEVSRRVEERRVADPYFLTSRTFAMGSLLTEGAHLHLDRSRDWKGALALLLDAVTLDQAALGCGTLVLRDFASHDVELGEHLRASGLVAFPMLDSLVLELDVGEEEQLARLSQRARAHQRREVLPWEPAYETEVLRAGGRTPSPEELAHLHAMYRAVEARSLEINSFELPRAVFARMLEHPDWELVLLRLRPEHGGPADGRPVAFGAHFRGRAHYAPMIIGLDYDYVYSHRCYRQALHRAIRRGRELGARRVLLGMGASLEKRRFGAQAHGRVAYGRADDHYAAEVLASFEADAGRAAVG